MDKTQYEQMEGLINSLAKAISEMRSALSEGRLDFSNIYKDMVVISKMHRTYETNKFLKELREEVERLDLDEELFPNLFKLLRILRGSDYNPQSMYNRI